MDPSKLCLCCPSPLSLEQFFFEAHPNGRLGGWGFVCGLLAANLFATLFPMMFTKQWTLEGANDECRERYSVLFHARHADEDSDLYDPSRKLGDDAIAFLLPAHGYNVTALWVSSAGYLMWRFASPHNTERAARLDYTRKARETLLSFVQQIYSQTSFIPC